MTVNRNNNQRSVREANAAREFMGQARERMENDRRPSKPIRTYQVPGTNASFSTRPFRHDTPLLDGIDHINVAHDALTELGVALNMDFEMSWKHPVLGEFMSLSSFWQYITRPVQDDGIRFLKSYNLRRVMKRVREAGEPVVNVENFRAVMLHAIYERITQSDIFEMFITSEMPFENYHVATDKGQPARRQNTASWLIPALGMMRYCMINDLVFPSEQFCDTDTPLDVIYAQLKQRPRPAAPSRPDQAELARRLSERHRPKAPEAPRKEAKPKAPRPTLREQLAAEDPEVVATLAFPSVKMAQAYALSLVSMDLPRRLRAGEEITLNPDTGITVTGNSVPQETIANFPVMMVVLMDSEQSMYLRFGETTTIRERFIDIQTDISVSIPDGVGVKEERSFFAEQANVAGLTAEHVYKTVKQAGVDSADNVEAQQAMLEAVDNTIRTA